MKESYINLVIGRYLASKMFNDLVGNEWIVEDRYAELVDRTAKESFLLFGYDLPDGFYRDNAVEIFDLLKAGDAILFDGDEYTGVWFKFDLDAKHRIISSYLVESTARQRVANLGKEALARAIRKIAGEDGLIDLSEIDSDESLRDHRAPAADRIVTFDHNSSEVAEIDKDLDSIQEQIRGDNEGRLVPSTETARIVEQFRVGRELLRIGRVSTRAIYGLLFPALIYLSTTFADEAVGQLAGKLIEALAKLLGLAL